MGVAILFFPTDKKRPTLKVSTLNIARRATCKVIAENNASVLIMSRALCSPRLALSFLQFRKNLAGSILHVIDR